MSDSTAKAELITVRDYIRYAVSRFTAAQLFFGHGSDNAWDEAVYLTLHTLCLPLDRLEPFLDARLLPHEREALLDIYRRRCEDRLPAAYLTHEAWLGEHRFYVDDRVIVPRFDWSFMGRVTHETAWRADRQDGRATVLVTDSNESVQVLNQRARTGRNGSNNPNPASAANHSGTLHSPPEAPIISPSTNHASPNVRARKNTHPKHTSTKVTGTRHHRPSVIPSARSTLNSAP